MVQAGRALREHKDYIAAQKVFRPDVYQAAFAGTNVPLPVSSAKLEGSISSNPTAVVTVQGRLVLHPDRFFDGRSFDPDQLDAYLAASPKSLISHMHNLHFATAKYALEYLCDSWQS